MVTFWTKPISADPLDTEAEEGRQYTAVNVTVTLDPDNPNATISVPIIDNNVRTHVIVVQVSTKEPAIASLKIILISK